MTGKGLRIGITIGLREEGESLWTNGIKQNAIFLAEALTNVPLCSSVRLVNTTSVRVTDGLTWDRARWPTVSFEDAKDSLDVLIELGGQVSAAQTDYLKRQGTRLVSYCCGVEYVNAIQSVLFDRPLWGLNLFVNRRYDAVWMVPQVANISQHFFQTLRRCPAHIVPFVWDPVLLEQRNSDLPEAGAYTPRAGPRRLSVMEPNLDVVKFCLYPVLIAEEAFRRAPDKIAFLHVTNAERLATQSSEFIALMGQLDVVRANKAAFVGRYETARFLPEMTDVMISHQWDNPLNYFYLEVCWLGYPLVHNAQLCDELGYYYQGHDVQAGCQRLLYAMQNHDLHWDDYRRRQRSFIARYLPTNIALIAHYEGLLARLMRQPLA